MRLLVFLCLATLCFSSTLDKLESYNCETQNVDFQITALDILGNHLEFYNKNKLKKLFASYYYQAQDTCKVNSKKWCEAYKRVSEKDYETFKTLYYFKCK